MRIPPLRMGSETEFGIHHNGSRPKATQIQQRIESLPHLRSAKGQGVFLGNGARCYIDSGLQNEYATPECTDPAELVTHELAGRLLLQSCAESIAPEHAMLCSNVDPLTGATWGTHENYECARPLNAAEQSDLESHLVTRIVYTGAGGLDPLEPGLRLVLSPRVATLRRGQSSQGLGPRSLVFHKGSNHGAGFRLHLMCGESLLSHEASYLKYATTRLVTALLSQGIRLGPGGFATSSMAVLRRINRDLALVTRIRLANGRDCTALDIQEMIWTDVAAHIDLLPDWAPRALQRWRAMLDDLRADHPSLPQRLDWMLFRDAARVLCEHHGIPVPDLPAARMRLREAFSTQSLRRRRHGETASQWLNPHARLIQARCAVGELYVRLHALHRPSLFDELAGSLHAAHRLPEVTDARIARAMTEPPEGRAARRACWIRRHPREASLRISWEMVFDLPREHRIPLHDTTPRPNEDPWAMGPAVLVRPLSAGDSLFRRGRYAEFTQGLAVSSPEAIAAWDPAFLETICLALGRLGRVEECHTFLAHYRQRTRPFSHAAITLSSRVHLGFRPDTAALKRVVEQAESLLNPTSDDPYYILILTVYRARLEMLHAITVEKRDHCIRSFADLIEHQDMFGRPRMLSRTQCYLAELLRLAGRREEALQLARAAVATYREQNLDGDLAFHGLTTLAKLTETSEATSALEEAIQLLSQNQNSQRLAHVLALRARRLGWTTEHAGLDRLVSTVPALEQCPTARRILRDWEIWCQPQDDAATRDYWGL